MDLLWIQDLIGRLSEPKMLLFIGLTLIPVIIWGIVFYKKDSTPSPIKNLLFTFFVGCFTVLPLFLYQHVFIKYYRPLYPVELVENVFLEFVFNTLIDFLAAMAFLAVFIGVTMAVLAVILSFFYKETIKNVFKGLFEETINFSAFGFFVLFVIAGEVLLEKYTGERIVPTLAGTFVILAVMEEYVKHLVVRFIDDHKIKDIDNAIIYSIMVGMAFAFVENIKYFLEADQSTLLNIFIGRSIFSIFGHILFSAIFGYYYGIAHFAKPIYAENYVEGKIFALPKVIHKILHLRTSIAYREEKMMEGLVLSTMIHTVFNIILELQLTFIIVPYLALGYMLLNHLLALKENQKQFGIIGTRALPEQEYEKLIWKISSIKWAEQIKAEREARERGEDPKKVVLKKHSDSAVGPAEASKPEPSPYSRTPKLEQHSTPEVVHNPPKHLRHYHTEQHKRPPEEPKPAVEKQIDQGDPVPHAGADNKDHPDRPDSVIPAPDSDPRLKAYEDYQKEK